MTTSRTHQAGHAPRFDLDDFLAACSEAVTQSVPQTAVREVLTRAMSRPSDVAATLRPTEGGITLLHQAPELTVIHAAWAPRMSLFPHDHQMWAAIGIYTGQESNAFFRRTAPGERTVVDAGGRQLDTGEVLVLGEHVIHAVANPTDRLTGAIHVYGGDFVHKPRSQWGPGPREERPYDMDEINRQFAEANRTWHATCGLVR